MSKPITIETISNGIRSGNLQHNEGLALIRGAIHRNIKKELKDLVDDMEETKPEYHLETVKNALKRYK